MGGIYIKHNGENMDILVLGFSKLWENIYNLGVGVVSLKTFLLVTSGVEPWGLTGVLPEKKRGGPPLIQLNNNTSLKLTISYFIERDVLSIKNYLENAIRTYSAHLFNVQPCCVTCSKFAEYRCYVLLVKSATLTLS